MLVHCKLPVLHHLRLDTTLQKEQCPAWGQDFNCIDGNRVDEQRRELIAREYHKIFRPHECDLPEWDAAGFGK